MSLAEWQIQLGQALIWPDPPGLCSLAELQGIEGARLALYEELLFNTVLETLESIYPYSYALLSENGENNAAWRLLVESYRRACPNASYKLMGAVSGFPDYLRTQAQLIAKMPYLAELACYEWLEMEVANLPDPILPSNLMQTVPEVGQWRYYALCWNQIHRLQTFQFNIPVALDVLREADYQYQSVSIAPQPVEVLIYRDPETLQARFFLLNGLTAALIGLSLPTLSCHDVMTALKVDLPMLQTIPMDVIQQQAGSLFGSCLQKGILLGFQPL